MLKQIKGNIITFTRFYTGEWNLEISKKRIDEDSDSPLAVATFEWDYNPHELDTDLIKLIMLTKPEGLTVEVITPYVPYLRSDKLIKKQRDGEKLIEIPMLSLIRDTCHNIEFIAPPQHNDIRNVEIKHEFKAFEEVVDSSIVIACDKSEYARLKLQGVSAILATKVRDESRKISNPQINDIDLDAIKASNKPIVLKDDLLSFGSTAVALIKYIEAKTGKSVDSLYIEYADGLHHLNKDFPSNVRVVALKENPHGGFAR